MEQVKEKSKNGLAKKILNIAIDVLILLVLIISVLVIIVNAGSKDKGVPNLFGYTFASVQSDSMTGVFEEGDVVVGKLADENTEIKVGDIISFWDMKDGVKFVNTHRVVEVFDYDGTKFYDTKGDKPGLGVDPYTKSAEEIISVYQWKIGGAGNFIDFLRQPIGFIFVIVLPFLLIIGWEAYRLIAIYIEHKKSQIMQAAATNKEVSDEEKQKIIEEYLKNRQDADNGVFAQKENDNNEN